MQTDSTNSSYMWQDMWFAEVGMSE